jgi:hypothetical protein
MLPRTLELRKIDQCCCEHISSRCQNWSRIFLAITFSYCFAGRFCAGSALHNHHLDYQQARAMASIQFAKAFPGMSNTTLTYSKTMINTLMYLGWAATFRAIGHPRILCNNGPLVCTNCARVCPETLAFRRPLHSLAP